MNGSGKKGRREGIDTAEEFAEALNEVASRALHDDDFRQQAIEDAAWAIRQVTDGKALAESVELTFADPSDEPWDSPWPGEYPNPGSYEARLPRHGPPLLPNCMAKMSLISFCSTPPFTDCS